MPKPPPVERFKISCEVGVADLGPVMAKLAHIEGLTVTGSELITEIRRFAQKNINGVPAQEFLAGWIKDNPTFTTTAATKAFEADGRVKTGAYGAIKILVEKGVVKKLSEGNYARADVKHLAAPKKKRTAKHPPKTFDKRGEDVVLSYAKRNHGRFNTPKLIEIFEDQGRARNSVYASIDVLLKKKLVKRVGGLGSGAYVLLQKAAHKPKAAKPPKVAPTVNGSAVEVEVAAHG